MKRIEQLYKHALLLKKRVKKNDTVRLSTEQVNR